MYLIWLVGLLGLTGVIIKLLELDNSASPPQLGEKPVEPVEVEMMSPSTKYKFMCEE